MDTTTYYQNYNDHKPWTLAFIESKALLRSTRDLHKILFGTVSYFSLACLYLDTPSWPCILFVFRSLLISLLTIFFSNHTKPDQTSRATYYLLRLIVRFIPLDRSQISEVPVSMLAMLSIMLHFFFFPSWVNESVFMICYAAKFLSVDTMSCLDRTHYWSISFVTLVVDGLFQKCR